jgi:hypothetical protein
LIINHRIPHHVIFSYSSGVCHEIVDTEHFLYDEVDQGALTCMMSLACWKSIDKPKLSPSPMLLIVFDGQYFIPHGIIPSFPVQLEGETVCVEVEVVDVPLDYNILLGQSWTYTMIMILSIIFWDLCFPHKGQIIIIDQLSFSHPNPSSRESKVPTVYNQKIGTVNLGVRIVSIFNGDF